MALVLKNLPANAEDLSDTGSIPGFRRSPVRWHGNPLQYFCLENSVDTGAWGLQSIESQRVGHTEPLSTAQCKLTRGLCISELLQWSYLPIVVTKHLAILE